MGLVEEAGCEIIPGIAVEALLKDEGDCVTGIRAGEDEITAHVVIVAEGQNSLLAERFLGAPRPKANQMAVGIKEVFELDEKTIEDRFLTPEGEGAAMLFVGDCTHGVVGGGFMYANKTSVSLGLVSTISEMEKADTTIYQAMEDFKNHPAVAPIIRGAEMVEHSGHMVSEGGANMVPELVHDGALIAGDAAMLCMNLGYMVRGMDLAVASGRFAAEAACEAIDAEDVSKAGLAGYKTRMDNSFVMQDLRTFSKWPHVMEEWDRMFTEYPKMVGEIFDSMFIVDGTPQQPLRKRIMPIVKQRGLFKLAKEVKGALSAL
jgi:electron transfer flavoprotein-quinone oxidoreductase